MADDENSEGVARLEAGMPPLLLDGTLRSKRELGHVLGVSGPAEPKGRQIVDGLVRLTDKSACEYQDCRTSLILFLRKGHADQLHRANDHFESCVSSLHRAINYLDRLRSLGYRRPNGEALVARPRDLEILRDSVRSKVRTFRDYLEHLEDDIIQNKIPPDRPASLHLGWERATINDALLAYRDVARWCNQLYDFATPLAVVTLSAGPVREQNNVSSDA